MMMAKVFENGRSQAVRLPKEYRFPDDEVMVNKIGDIVLLIPKAAKWENFMRAVDLFSPDFMVEDRGVQRLEEREEL
jgi:antitoxin VapB